jgi:hypothetical protein
MTTLDKIREYAKKHNMLFRDYRTQSFINEDPECRYQLIWNHSYHNFKKFNTQAEIEEFLFEEKNNQE